MKKEQTYFEKFIAEYGITPELNTVLVLKHSTAAGKNELQPENYFSASPEGDIKIQYPSLHGGLQMFDRATKGQRPFYRLRLHPENEAIKKHKYTQPPKSGTHIFHTPGVLEKYTKGEHFETLVLVEGEKKAFAGYIAGLHICGIAGIQQALFKNSEGKRQLHEDIVDIITKCRVQNIILLFDNDCFEIKFEEGKDLTHRISNYFTAVTNFKEACKGVVDKIDSNTEIYFSYITDQEFKGLDDLLLAKKKPQTILDDLLRFSNANHYFAAINLELPVPKIRKFFHIANVNDFWEYYQSIIGEKEFKYYRSSYKLDTETGTCKMVSMAEAMNYMRVGCDYFIKMLQENPATGESIIVYSKWSEATIKSDHSKEILQQIQKYVAWANEPMHNEYQQEIEVNLPSGQIGKLYNRYAPLAHTPQKGNCDASLAMVKHIFGESHFEFGLDYITLLYLKPTQKLPIICLLSLETGTGKSTFINWIKEIFGANMSLIGNNDFEDKFNAGWATKLIVACEETSLIDKNLVKEKLKNLTTARDIQLRDMQTSGYNVKCHLHFILATNNLNFIKIDRDERRWAVMKLTPFEKKGGKDDPRMLDTLIYEIPAFLDFLKTRTLHYPEAKTNLWFEKEAYITEAMQEVTNQTRETLERELIKLLQNEFYKYCCVIDVDDAGKKNVRTDAKCITEIFMNKSDMLRELTLSVKTANMTWLDRILRQSLRKPVCEMGRYENYKSRMDRNNGKLEMQEEKPSGTPYHFKIEEVFTDNELFEWFEPEEIEFIEAMKQHRKAIRYKPLERPKQEEIPF